MTETQANPIPKDLYLYVLMRTDMDSLGRGRAAAQAAHAANQFTDYMIIQPMLKGEQPNEHAMAWRDQADGFGTQIVLNGGNMAAISRVIEDIGIEAMDCEPTDPMSDVVTSVLIDPEYFVQDGKFAHRIENLPTCAWVFGSKAALYPFLRDFNLLSNDPTP